MISSSLWTAFAGHRLLASGPPSEVAIAVKGALGSDTAITILTFDERGRVIDLDLRGSDAEIVARLGTNEDDATPRGRGRPKLGVVPREVTLLPRHWDWLAAQPGGASAALRRLVDEARKADAGDTEARIAREDGYRFLSALAGDLPAFEEASRALFANDRPAFLTRTADWPADVRNHAVALAWSER